MRHGAGPFSSSHEIKTEAVNDLSAEIATISLEGENRGQRLGCYFCNDVVAPVDVSILKLLISDITPPTPAHTHLCFPFFITEKTILTVLVCLAVNL